MEGLEIPLGHLDNWDNHKVITVKDLRTMLKDVVVELKWLEDEKEKMERENFDDIDHH